MLAGRYIRSAEYEKARQILDSMPGGEEALGAMADKLMLQVAIYEKQGGVGQAIQQLQRALLQTAQKIQALISKLVDAELAAGHTTRAYQLSQKAMQIPALFDLWEHSAYVAPLQVALAQEDAAAAVAILSKLLSLVTVPWKLSDSPLYDTIPTNGNLPNMLPAILTEMERDSQYAFLRENEQFRQLLAQYRRE